MLLGKPCSSAAPKCLNGLVNLSEIKGSKQTEDM